MSCIISPLNCTGLEFIAWHMGWVNELVDRSMGKRKCGWLSSNLSLSLCCCKSWLCFRCDPMALSCWMLWVGQSSNRPGSPRDEENWGEICCLESMGSVLQAYSTSPTSSVIKYSLDILKWEKDRCSFWKIAAPFNNHQGHLLSLAVGEDTSLTGNFSFYIILMS